ncbi:TPM domain-containing protein [Marinobacter sp. SS21]|uniref:TPM domain-containing protein n=1 Tax=Marinobacter sp. SS21 TaxID=2979460 RepID=UPI002330258E|nr:TPM domain-containing protein [Marinobacter sp. SS21]MDC0662925.1 TPM domain-containing protein [Marinobacter sp. SS21]
MADGRLDKRLAWLFAIVWINLTAALLLRPLIQSAPPLVADRVGLLSDDDQAKIAEVHHFLLQDLDLDYRVVIDRDLGDIDLFAADYFRDQDVGTPSHSGRGLLLVLDVSANQLRLEVSHALEPVYTDAFTAYIEHRQLTEFFAANRIADGVLATTELLVTRATNAAAGLDPSTEGWSAGSGGGGARMAARLGEGQAERSTEHLEHGSAASLQDTLERYRTTMVNRNNNPALAIYSRVTRDLLAQRVMTPAQMDNVARSLRECGIDSSFRSGNRAVLRSPIAERTCPPYFFVREDNQWRLDFTVMIEAIRFGRNNQWRLVPDYAGPYQFGFLDLRFDQNGYPYPP